MPNVVSGRIYVDNEITQQVIGIIDRAQSKVAIISPYIDRVMHVEQAITRAMGRGVKATVFVRKDGTRLGGNKSQDALDWFKKSKVDVIGVPNLHAKFYINETEAVLTSMNLLNTSWTGSLELGFAVEGDAHAQLTDYLNDRVLPQSQSVTTEAKSTRSPRQSARTKRTSSPRSASPKKKETTGFFGSVFNAVKDALDMSEGYCIRCGERLSESDYQAGKTLCRKDYRAWAEFKRPNYPEKYCVVCGNQRKTTYASPKCNECVEDGR